MRIYNFHNCQINDQADFLIDNSLFLSFIYLFIRNRREALEAAVSDKDAHLALIELSGIKTEKQAEQAEKLRADRTRLLEKLKEEVNNKKQPMKKR